MLVTAVVLLALLLAGVRLLGVRVYTVLSGSMEPAYHVGSLIYVKPVPAETLAAGDAITFRMFDGPVVTHRIVRVLPEENGSGPRFVTKGDANNAEDAGQVSARDVIGRPVFTIPWLGYLVAYIQQPPGTYVAVAAGALLLLLFLLPELLFSGDKNRGGGASP